jgi:putative SOS response-associated peptidase YedK
MCNDYELAILLDEMNAAIDRQLGLQFEIPNAPPSQWDLPFAERVYPRYFGLILRPAEPLDPLSQPLQTRVASWNLIPPFHRGSPKDWKAQCNNSRSEEMSFKPTFRDAVKKRRCIIPATAFYEWTGPKGSKTRHRITRRDGEPMFLAGLWSPANDPDRGRIDTFSMVMQPGAPPDDIAPFHDRQPVPLDHDSARRWLDLSTDMTKDSADWAAVIKPPAPGTLAFDPPEPVAA